MLKIYNTLSKSKEKFKPIKEGLVGFYQCGPTVYWTQHIGNMRAVVMADVMIRTLKYLGYQVNFVRNYTDVGHLTSDEDTGEDKLEKGAKREGITPQEIANKYIKIYENDIKDLNTLSPKYTPKATENIQEIIEMIQILWDKGFAYKTNLGVYFNISKIEKYTKLSGQKLEDLNMGAGTGEITDPEKINPADSAIWIFKKGPHKNALQTWESPWGEGFPGWHIECSVMTKKYIGKTIDIHMGGIEHIPIHHTNEIAYSESANDTELAHYWIHNEHLLVNNEKMSKSEGTSFAVKEIKEKGFDPLALRYFYLQAHYRSKQNFTWEALESAQKGLMHLYENIVPLKIKNEAPKWMFWKKESTGNVNQEYKNKFKQLLEDDFNTPGVLAVISELLKSKMSNEDKLATLYDIDDVLGLSFVDADKKVPQEIPMNKLPKNIKEILSNRKIARKRKDYFVSDKLRGELINFGYIVKDTPNGQKIYKK